MSDALSSFIGSIVFMATVVALTALTVRQCGKDVTVVRHLDRDVRIVRIESRGGTVTYAAERWACDERRCRYWRTGSYSTEESAMEDGR